HSAKGAKRIVIRIFKNFDNIILNITVSSRACRGAKGILNRASTSSARQILSIAYLASLIHPNNLGI
ncbi:MAG: hypothetical protein AAFP70_21500, partial [Calditrichota bacterium]